MSVFVHHNRDREGLSLFSAFVQKKKALRRRRRGPASKQAELVLVRLSSNIHYATVPGVYTPAQQKN